MVSVSYLLDTHCLLWFQDDNPNLSKEVLQIIQNTENKIYFSQISLFEVAIKESIGKLPFFKATVKEIYEQAVADGFEFLDIKNPHIENYQNVPLFDNHRDPFDRLIIATAIIENLTILSDDRKFDQYISSIKVIW